MSVHWSLKAVGKMVQNLKYIRKELNIVKKKHILLLAAIGIFFCLLIITKQKKETQFILKNLQHLDQVQINFVYDGDTFRTSTGERIRLIGIDTPEMNWEEGNPEFFAREAYEYAREKLLWKKVYLEYDQERRDKYNRTLVYLYLADGTFFNQKLIEEGYASLLLIPPNLKHSEALKEAEERAQNSGLGIWENNKKITYIFMLYISFKINNLYNIDNFHNIFWS